MARGRLWDPEQFGQLQNQAVGYLFPMGPSFALGDVAGVPAWITQRFWPALPMCLALTGTWRLGVPQAERVTRLLSTGLTDFTGGSSKHRAREAERRAKRAVPRALVRRTVG